MGLWRDVASDMFSVCVCVHVCVCTCDPFHAAGWRGVTLLISLHHVVAGGDGQEHLQAGDQEATTDPGR